MSIDIPKDQRDDDLSIKNIINQITADLYDNAVIVRSEKFGNTDKKQFEKSKLKQ